MNKKNIKIMIADSDKKRAEKLVNNLKLSGYITRAHLVNTLEDLENSLNNQSWDLLLTLPYINNIKTDSILKIMHSRDKDVPVIVMTEEDKNLNTGKWFKNGVKDVVHIMNNDKLVWAAKRECDALQVRRSNRKLKRSIAELKKQHTSLLSSRCTSEAYLQKNRYLFANNSFLSLLKYENIGKLLATEVSETLAENSRNYFEDAVQKKETTENMPITLLNTDKKEVSIHAKLMPVIFKDKNCMKLIIEDNSYLQRLVKQAKDIGKKDATTGFYTKQYVTKYLEKLILDTASGKNSGALLWIYIKNFIKHEKDIESVSMDDFLSRISVILKENFLNTDIIARYSEDVFVIITKTTKENIIIEQSKEIAYQISTVQIKTNDGNKKFITKIGCCYVGDSTTNAVDAFEKAKKAAELIENDTKISVNIFENQDDSLNKDTSKLINNRIQSHLTTKNYNIVFRPIINLRNEAEENYEVFISFDKDNDTDINEYVLSMQNDNSVMACDLTRKIIAKAIKLQGKISQKSPAPTLFLPVNATLFLQKDFLIWIKNIIHIMKIKPTNIVLQISEDNVSILNQKKNSRHNELCDIGFRLCVSNFGCNIDPIKILETVPCEFVKIDDSFTEDIADGISADNYLKKLVEDINKYNKKIIISSIDTAKILAEVWKLGLTFAQGSYFQEITHDPVK